ncbi:MAG: hypothetical protein LBS36_11530 [Oscillospiraceae bacterium]|jgi:hypothetical protein|nr:hypothetical protein [Oscillospiraceae bacterium]
MNKNLQYFMRESAKAESIVSVPGIESIKDEHGEVVPFEVKKLSRKSVQEIFAKYETQEIVYDANKKPYVVDGEVVCRTKTDHARAVRHLIVEALQYPNLKDPALMDFFNCYDITDMPLLVFPQADEYAQVVDVVMRTLGLRGASDEQDREVSDAKNS